MGRRATNTLLVGLDFCSCGDFTWKIIKETVNYE